MKSNPSIRASRGFSLVELLVTVVSIAIMAAIAIPNLAQITGHAHYAKNERNAQNVAMLASSARAAGATNTWATLDDVINDLEQTIYVTNQATVLEFNISHISAEERAELGDYLEVSNGNVVYTPKAAQ